MAYAGSIYKKIRFVTENLAGEDAIYSKQLQLCLMADRHKLLGWVRRHDCRITGAFICLAREIPLAEKILKAVPDCQFKIFRQSEFFDRHAPWFRLSSFIMLRDIDLSKPWHSEDLVVFDEVNEDAEVCGWAYLSSKTGARAEVHIFIDEVFVGKAKADRFRQDLLHNGVGDGEHAFTYKIPSCYLDGEKHVIRIELHLPSGSKNVQTHPRTIKLPFVERLEAVWRQASRLSEFHKIRNCIIENGLEGQIDNLVGFWDRIPGSIFIDAGIAERYRRESRPFLSLRERLSHRFESRHCPQLLRNFASKKFTKEYCDKKGIRTPETMLIAGDVEKIKRYNFPQRFVLKPSAGSGECTYLYSEGVDLRTRTKVSIDEILTEVTSFKKRNPDAEFVIEELVQQKGASDRVIPLDYKISVFGGKARFVLVVDRNGFGEQLSARTQFGWFSVNWDPTPFPFKFDTQESINFARPTSLEQMISIAEAVGSECEDYVRVDLYESKAGVMLGEVTTFPGAGRFYTDFGDRIVSQLWHVSILSSGKKGFLDWTEYTRPDFTNQEGKLGLG